MTVSRDPDEMTLPSLLRARRTVPEGRLMMSGPGKLLAEPTASRSDGPPVL